MPNTFKTIQAITEESLLDFHNELNILKTTDTSLTRNYESTLNGYKTGATVEVDLPLNFLVHDGPNIVTYDGIEERTVPITITQDKNTNLGMSLLEKTLDARTYERYVKPQVTNHANEAEAWYGTLVGQSTANHVGTAGSAIANLGPLAQAKALAAKLGIDATMLCLEEDNYSTLIQDSNLMNNQDAPMSKAINRKYYAGNFYNFDTYHSINAYRHEAGVGDATAIPANGVVAAGTVRVLSVTGDEVLKLKGLGNVVTGTFLKGDKITVSGVYSVNPKNMRSTGRLMQFVVTANAPATTAGGDVDIAISPKIISDPTSPYRNVTNAIAVDSTVSLATANKLVGSTEKHTYGVSFAYNPAYLMFVCPPLAAPRLNREQWGRKVDPETNIALLMTDAYSQDDRKNTTRLDSIYGGYPYEKGIIAVLGS